MRAGTRLEAAFAVFFFLSAGAGAAQDGAAARVLVGELVRLDLSRSCFTLKAGDREPREYEVVVDSATRLTSQGRVLRLEDLRPGDRVVAVVTEEAGGRRRASLVKLGPSSYAAPAPPSGSPSPRS